jgi:hypothetical protein
MTETPDPSRDHRPFMRISDRLMDAFEEAIDQRELEIAEVLHSALELVMTRRAGPQDVEKRDIPYDMLDSYEKLEDLRRSVAAEGDRG